MKLFFSVGEPSGDLHGANLIRQLTSRDASAHAVGLGGPRMQEAGCELLQDMSELAVMGLFPVLAKLPTFFALRDRVEQYFRDERPDAVILIDYPGFNWHVARAAKEQGIPVYYYGVPQLWAWASWRVRKVRETVDHALCKLPFEEAWFRARDCQATYVGHPYFDELASHRWDHPFLDSLAMQRGRLVTILPGSRTHEVRANLPQLVRAAAKVRRAVPDARFAVASYSERQAVLARQYVARAGIEARVHVGHTPELILSAEACLACSGSVSLELLYHTKPSVILYHVPWWTYAVVRSLVKVRYITLVNLLTAGDIYPARGQSGLYRPDAPEHAHVLFPEYPTCRDRSTDLARHVITWLTDENERQRVVAGLAELKQRVGQGGASERAADYILQTLCHGPSIPLPGRAESLPGAYRRAS